MIGCYFRLWLSNLISFSATNIYDVPCITDPKIRLDFDLQNVLHLTGSDADLEHSDVMSVAGLMKLFLVGNYGFYLIIKTCVCLSH